MDYSKQVLQAQVGSNRLSSTNAALLMVDHQTGLMQLVRDYGPDEFKNNILALAGVAALFKLPTILTTSAEDGPNGPLLPELREKFPHAPYIARPGEINAWDNDEFVKAVRETKRKKLIIAGIVTDVCVTFPTLAALNEGFEVYVVVDVSGTFSEVVREAALNRMTRAGAVLINWFAVAAELQRDDWRKNGEKLAVLFRQYCVSYANLINSHEKK